MSCIVNKIVVFVGFLPHLTTSNPTFLKHKLLGVFVLFAGSQAFRAPAYYAAKSSYGRLSYGVPDAILQSKEDIPPIDTVLNVEVASWFVPPP